MPSYTFVTSALSVVLRGAIPVFIDINLSDLNMNPALIEPAITEQTRAIMPVHYAGAPCDMETISRLSQQYNLIIIEDSTHAVLSGNGTKYLGTIGHFGCLSFHETKNLSSGEGGILLINDPAFSDRAHLMRDKGTDRRQFNLGYVDKYTWQEIGSSFSPTEITAALIWSQLEEADEINARRIAIWKKYRDALSDLAERYHIILPKHPHKGHIFYCIFSKQDYRDAFIRGLQQHGISSVFHYIPLHNSPGGLKYGRAFGDLSVTEKVSNSLTRLPIWTGLEEYLDEVIDHVRNTIISIHK
jgi:dTDP-4-amino-4,6-dideoxygalactose transaminase